MRKNVLVCFDVYGTLIKPRQPVFKQYAEVARKYGVNGFTDEQLATSFNEAYKEESEKNPNYGHASGMGSQNWWTSVIERTFAPFIPGNDNEKRLPPVLAPALIHRFNCKEGFDLWPDAAKVFSSFADTRAGQLYRRVDRHDDQMPEARLVVGVITNSDDRVPDVLTSLGLKVKPLRHGEDPRQYHPTNEAADVDFAIMSYDVGHEKPDKRIFEAADTMLQEMLKAEGHKDAELTDWRKIYVGDEMAKDVIGATDTGWEAVFVDRGEGSPPDSTVSPQDYVETRSLESGTKFQAVRDLRAIQKVMG